MVTQMQPTWAQLPPQSEAAQLRNCITQAEQQLAALSAHPGMTPPQRKQYEAHIGAYILAAQQRLAQLTGAAPRQLPSAPMTPSQAQKAARKLAKKAKRDAKRNAQLKRLAQGAVTQLPDGSPLRASAQILMDESKPMEKRKAALHLLVDSVPINAPHAMMVKMVAHEFVEGEEDDDEDDE